VFRALPQLLGSTRRFGLTDDIDPRRSNKLLRLEKVLDRGPGMAVQRESGRVEIRQVPGFRVARVEESVYFHVAVPVCSVAHLLGIQKLLHYFREQRCSRISCIPSLTCGAVRIVQQHADEIVRLICWRHADE